MFKSRTVTISLRFYGSLAVAALLGAFVVGVTSQHSSIIDQVIGPLDLGWKGGVGNHLGYTVLVGVAVAAIFLATLFTAWRDADANAEAESAGLEAVPLARAPIGANYWPIVSAFALGAVLVGSGHLQQGAGPHRRRRAGRGGGHVDHAGLGRAGHR